MKLNFEKDTQVDKYKLDEEWVRISTLLWEYGKALSDTSLERDRLKQNLDLIESETDYKIRSGTISLDLAKPTESSIKNYINQTKEYQTALTKLNDINHEVSVLSSAVRAIQAKKSAMEWLTKMWFAAYFTDTQDFDMKERLNKFFTKEEAEKFGVEVGDKLTEKLRMKKQERK
jgi:hypothetical protein